MSGKSPKVKLQREKKYLRKISVSKTPPNLKKNIVSYFWNTKMLFNEKSIVHAVLDPGRWQKHTHTQTDIVTYIINWPGSQFCENTQTIDTQFQTVHFIGLSGVPTFFLSCIFLHEEKKHSV